jgi:hypothetical protein
VGIIKRLLGLESNDPGDDRRHIAQPIPESNRGQRDNARTSRKRGGSPGAGGAGHGEKPNKHGKAK